MTRPAAKGWCPSAFRPMLSGDGLIMRIKPPFGRLSSDQLQTIATLSKHYGNGIIDVTSRANLQIRGVQEADYPTILAAAQKAALARDSYEQDRLNLIIAPFTEKGSIGYRCAEILYQMADKLPELPAKFGFAIDCGTMRYLAKASCDLRIEYDDKAGLLIRCDGAEAGFITSEAALYDDITKLLEWYLSYQDKNDGRPVGRMRQLLRFADLPQKWQAYKPLTPQADLKVGSLHNHRIFAAPFGQLLHHSLTELADNNHSLAITIDRLMMTSIDAKIPKTMITDPHDPHLQIIACAGAPHCASSSINTHALATKLVTENTIPKDKIMHISGCQKGCASPLARDICIIGNQGRFDLAENSCAWDTPSITSLTEIDLIAKLRKIR